ncbi:hypothetical protein Tco_1504914 [Tanacetum coccineum]
MDVIVSGDQKKSIAPTGETAAPLASYNCQTSWLLEGIRKRVKDDPCFKHYRDEYHLKTCHFFPVENTSSTNEVSTAHGVFRKKGIFAREFAEYMERNQGKRAYGDNARSNAPTMNLHPSTGGSRCF